MNDLGIIACGAGLRDGLNPCILMTGAVFIAYGLWFSRNFWLRSIFVLTYAVGLLIFNFGPAQIFVFQKGFIAAAKAIYFVSGAGSFVLGVLFFKDWFLICRGAPAQTPTDEKIKSFRANGLAAGAMTGVLAAGLSALATLWPINNYIMILGNTTLVKGQWQAAVPLLSVYVLVSMWPLWFVWAFLSIKNMRPSLLKIVCAAIFFTASSSIILIFK